MGLRDGYSVLFPITVYTDCDCYFAATGFDHRLRLPFLIAVCDHLFRSLFSVAAINSDITTIFLFNVLDYLLRRFWTISRVIDQAHLYVTKRGHVSAHCRLSPEEEMLMLDKATRVASIAAAEAAKETAQGAKAHTSLGEQAGR